MKIWVDDLRMPPTEEWNWVTSVDEAIATINYYRHKDGVEINVIDLDHDAGEYVEYGGDYIKILNYMEEHQINNIPIHIHSMNPVGVENMRRIVKKNNWVEIV